MTKTRIVDLNVVNGRFRILRFAPELFKGPAEIGFDVFSDGGNRAYFNLTSEQAKELVKVLNEEIEQLAI